MWSFSLAILVKSSPYLTAPWKSWNRAQDMTPSVIYKSRNQSLHAELSALKKKEARGDIEAAFKNTLYLPAASMQTCEN